MDDRCGRRCRCGGGVALASSDRRNGASLPLIPPELRPDGPVIGDRQVVERVVHPPGARQVRDCGFRHDDSTVGALCRGDVRVGVVGDEVREGGRFVGFRVLSFYPDDPALSSVDLSSGDVVVRVNGQSIERPEHAIRVWDSLRVASELVVDVLRDGEPRELRFAIVD